MSDGSELINSWGKKKRSMGMKDVMFEIVADQMKNEISLSGGGFIWSLLLANSTILYTITIDASVFTHKERFIENSSSSWMVKSVCWVSAVYISLLCCFVMLRVGRVRKEVKIGWLGLVSVYLTLFYTYVVFPLMVWSHTRILHNTLLADQSISGLFSYPDIGIASMSFIIGGFVQFISVSFFRNTIPSNSILLSLISRSKELPVQLLNTLQIISMTILYEYDESFHRHLGSFVVSSGLHMIALIVMLNNRIYWYFSMNYVTLCSLVCLTTIKLSCDLYRLGIFDNLELSMTINMCIILMKLARNRLLYISRIDFTIPDISGSKRKEGMCYFDSLLRSLRNGTDGEWDSMSKMYYMGVAKSLLERLETDEAYLLRKKSAGDSEEDWSQHLLTYLSKTQGNDAETLELILWLDLIKIVPSLSKFKGFLGSLNILVRSLNWGKQFSLFNIKILFERRLMNMYKGKLRNEVDISLSIEEIYEYIHTTEESMVEDNYLDIHLPIRSKNRYIDICEAICDEISMKMDLMSKISSNTRLRCSMLFGYNRYIMNKKKMIRVMIDQFIEELEENNAFIGYFIAGVMVYMKIVVFDHAKSKKLFQIYKTKRQKLIFASVSGPITPVNLFKESAFLQVSIQKGTEGNIIDHSHDFGLYLGMPADKGKSVIGTNCNQLFPSYLRDVHSFYMVNMQRFFQLNLQREWMVVGFDGELKEISFIVKIVPTFTSMITSSISIRPSTDEGRLLLLLNRKNEVIASKKTFQQIIDACGLSEKLVSIGELSNELTDIINLIRELDKYLNKPLVRSHNNDIKIQELRSKLRSLYSEFQAANGSTGIDYMIQSYSAYSDFFPGISLIANIEITSFKEEELAKVYLKFKLDKKKRREFPDEEANEKQTRKTSEIKDSENASEKMQRMSFEFHTDKGRSRREREVSLSLKGEKLGLIGEKKKQELIYEDAQVPSASYFILESWNLMKKYKILSSMNTKEGRGSLKEIGIESLASVVSIFRSRREIIKVVNLEPNDSLIEANQDIIPKINEPISQMSNWLLTPTAPTKVIEPSLFIKSSSLIRPSSPLVKLPQKEEKTKPAKRIAMINVLKAISNGGNRIRNSLVRFPGDHRGTKLSKENLINSNQELESEKKHVRAVAFLMGNYRKKKEKKSPIGLLKSKMRAVSSLKKIAKTPSFSIQTPLVRKQTEKKPLFGDYRPKPEAYNMISQILSKVMVI